MIRQPKTLVALLLVLVPAYVSLTAFVYWYWLQPPPMRVIAFGPFVSAPVTTPEDAEQFKIEEAQTDELIYVFEQWCLDRPTTGAVSLVWLNGWVHKVPERQTIGKDGCHAKSFPVRVPHVQSETHFTLRKQIAYNSNPVREHVVTYPELSLRVLP